MKTVSSPLQPAPARPPLAETMRRVLQDLAHPATTNGFPRAWWRHLGDNGLLGTGFDSAGPAAQSASDISTLTGIVARETASMGLSLAWLMNQMLGRFVLAPQLRGDRQRALLQSMASGDTVLALSISEPGAGAHPKHLRCSARRDGDDWIIDGRKAFVSNGPAADVFIVLAVSGEADGHKRFDAFLINADTPGLTRELHAKVTGLEPLGHCGLLLTGCRIPESQRLGTPGLAFDTIARPVRVIEDTLLMGAMLGAMQAELDALALWLRGTARPPELVRGLGALQLELDALSPVAHHAAWHLDQHGPDERLAAFNVGAHHLLKHWQSACESFAAAFDIHEPTLLCLARDLRLVLGIARGVAEIRQRQAGEKLLQTKENTYEIISPVPL